MLKPLGDRVVLKIEEKEQTVGGFVLAGASKADTKTAEVVAVGEGVRTLSGELIAPAVKAGDHVLVESHAGIEVKDGEERGAANGRIIYRALEVCATVEDFCKTFYADSNHDHMVFPGMVYISHPTEYGTLYTKEELTDLSATCYDCGLYLFVDGARMAYGLASEANDLNLQDYANLCDVFYLGGTKCGALFGEAVIINNPDLDQDFRYAIKQHGAMLAKGRLLGLQFLALLNGEDGTGSSPYYTMAAKADRQAMRIRAAFEAKGCAMLFDSPTNQQFPILPNSWYNALSEKYAMTLTAKPDAEHTAVRFCTSWATRDEDVDALLADIASL